jgi:hypothetical protein
MADGAPSLARSRLAGWGHELRSRADGVGGLAWLGRREELGWPAGCGRETETVTP